MNEACRVGGGERTRVRVCYVPYILQAVVKYRVKFAVRELSSKEAFCLQDRDCTHTVVCSSFTLDCFVLSFNTKERIFAPKLDDAHVAPSLSSSEITFVP